METSLLTFHSNTPVFSTVAIPASFIQNAAPRLADATTVRHFEQLVSLRNKKTDCIFTGIGHQYFYTPRHLSLSLCMPYLFFSLVSHYRMINALPSSNRAI